MLKITKAVELCPPRDHDSDAGKQLSPNNVLFEHINKEKNERIAICGNFSVIMYICPGYLCMDSRKIPKIQEM